MAESAKNRNAEVRQTSPDVRAARGRALRDDVPLEVHAEVSTGADRPDPIGILIAQDAHRRQELVPIRHGRMGATPFTFYRGAAGIMASDLARTPRTTLDAQICGDAHLSNFGLFKGPDRRLLFDINDFDETATGPFEWDLKRLVASITIVGRHNGIEPKKTASATRAAVRGYRTSIARVSTVSPLDLFYTRIDALDLLDELDQRHVKRATRIVEKATRKDSIRALGKLTTVVDGRRVIVPAPPVITRAEALLEGDLRAETESFFDEYLASLPPHRASVLTRYRVVDIALKVVGVGSVGTRCLIVLLESSDGSPLFMQLKEATTSVLEPHVGASEYDQSGERVVRGQRLMQAAGDIFLGWSRDRTDDGSTLDFYVRQLWDGKGSVEVEDMDSKRLKLYAEVCGANVGSRTCPIGRRSRHLRIHRRRLDVRSHPRGVRDDLCRTQRRGLRGAPGGDRHRSGRRDGRSLSRHGSAAATAAVRGRFGPRRSARRGRRTPRLRKRNLGARNHHGLVGQRDGQSAEALEDQRRRQRESR